MGLKRFLTKLTGGSSGSDGATADAGRVPAATPGDLDAARAELASGDPARVLAAIDRLEALARDHQELHWTIMDTLVAHVRERRPSWKIGDGPPPDDPDVQRVLAVLGRRRWVETEALPLGLFQVDLRGADLTGCDLRRADLSRSHLGGADFAGSRLDGANFQEAFLDGAAMLAVQLAGANFLAADLRRTDLGGAVLDGCVLTEADLSEAELADASLRDADLTEATLDGTNLCGADLSTVKGLTTEQLATATLDAKTVLPPDLTP